MVNQDPKTFAIIGAAMEVHRQLGCGFLESVYHDALAVEFQEVDVPFRREVELAVQYKSRLLPSTFRADFICFDTVIVELKAMTALSGTEASQVLNYLKATGLEVGLLINFGAPSLQHKRFIRHDNWTAGNPQTS